MKKLLFPALAGAALLALAACGGESAAPSAALAPEPPPAQTQPRPVMTDDEEFTGRTAGSAVQSAESRAKPRRGSQNIP